MEATSPLIKICYWIWFLFDKGASLNLVFNKPLQIGINFIGTLNCMYKNCDFILSEKLQNTMSMLTEYAFVCTYFTIPGQFIHFYVYTCRISSKYCSWQTNLLFEKKSFGFWCGYYIMIKHIIYTTFRTFYHFRVKWKSASTSLF